MADVGVVFSNEEDLLKYKYALLVMRPTDTLTKMELEYNASSNNLGGMPLRHSIILEEDNNTDYKSYIKPETGYVGLVNQAMTCYLNSLLQALYMTPEFRNALYNWEYTSGSDTDEARSIPYQLQNLFLNLQTSTKSAVETTALTKSFGWDSTEAWQQHDIQELCRVMFEALEQKFKNTEQADLINRFYEGKMIDYVKCLECGTEKSREDTFLDIPLPVRPFGSNVAYNSVEEALRAFVQYETLEGSNQYHCEKCNKKCNAHKGLKFTKFPYLLTLHLKRFDFDFNTFHRIKLNDKVTFPNILNLNHFVSSTTDQESSNSEENTNLAKCDDSSTTDSGTLDNDYTSCENSLPNSNHSRTTDPDDDDEGVDVLSNGPSTSTSTEHNHENEKNHSSNATKGPYNYELFSIMIHSGSASGGHYYAYIKDFRTQEWLCFNDQNVTQITNDDIQKTYGGGPTRSYYSGACSSTNAYMLMYRQIDPARNTLPMQVHDFPSHIQKLLKKIKEKEENKEKMKENEDNDRIFVSSRDHDRNDRDEDNDRIFVSNDHDRNDRDEDSDRRGDRVVIHTNRGRYYKRIAREYLPPSLCRDFMLDPTSENKCMIKVLVGCLHPSEIRMNWLTIDFSYDITWAEATKLCWWKFNLDGVVNLDQCRLVRYDAFLNLILCRYEGMEERTFEDVWKTEGYTLLLEIRDANQMFEENEQNVITSKVYVLDVTEKKITEDPLLVRALRSLTVKEYKTIVAMLVGMNSSEMTVILGEPGSRLKLMDYDDNAELSSVNFTDRMDVFVSSVCNDEWKSFVETTTSCEIITNYANRANIITVRLKLPDFNELYLKELYAPTLEKRCKDTEKPIAESPSKPNVNDLHNSVTSKSSEALKIEKSNEDVSKNASPQLEEGEKWNTPEQSNSEDSSLSDSDKTLVGDALEYNDFHVMYYRPISTNNEPDNEYYFKVTPYEAHSSKFLKVEADKKMKYRTFIKKLEPYIGVPSEYFKIFYRNEDLGEFMYFQIQKHLLFYNEDEYLKVKVGRFFDFRIKVYMFLPQMDNLFKFLGEWFFHMDMTVADVKRDILADIKEKHDMDIPFDRCRLREKHLTLATKVYLDDQKLEDLMLYRKSEMAIQELLDKDPVTNSSQIIVCVKNVNKLYEPCAEIVMDGKSIAEMRKKLSALTNIPEKHIEIAKLEDDTSLMFTPLTLHMKSMWHRQESDVEFDIEYGSLFLYRDNRYRRDLLPKLTSRDESNEVTIQDVSNVKFISSLNKFKQPYTRRKEKALRIHLTGTE
ncbi:ubiquitin specific protease 47 isoform X2 [Nomia melanderi]|nr:ubiquitin carboxyl-terminal hydrolase 47 isoform X2 [Nomia melanderi]